jgi:hypothetical protein
MNRGTLRSYVRLVLQDIAAGGSADFASHCEFVIIQVVFKAGRSRRALVPEAQTSVGYLARIAS